MEYHVRLMWDPEALVWLASSDDIPGFCLEGGSFNALLERVKFAVPELLELNGCPEAETLVFSMQDRRDLVIG